MRTMKGPENVILHERIERATMNSRVARWLQTPMRRRLCVAGFIASVLGFFAYVAHVDWLSLYAANDGGLRLPGAGVVFAVAAFAALAIATEQLLFMSIRPVLSFRDEAYDERQKALVTEANGKARYSGLIFLAALTVAGALRVQPFALVYLGALFMMLTFMTPHLVLAWTLPNMREAGHENDE